MNPLRFPLSLVLLLFLWLPVARGEDIMPPFGLEWGEAPERLNTLLANGGAKVVEKKTLHGRTVWTVEGLVQPNLKCTVFYFRNGGLNEVEMQYQNATWIDNNYNDFMSNLRTRIERRFGPGKLTARSKAPVEGVTQTLVGYSWARGPSQIDLVYFAAEVPSQVYRTVSLHYKSLQ